MSKSRFPNDRCSSVKRHFFLCPHCGERISVLLDLTASFQRYVEDCEVCCNPVEIIFRTDEGVIVSFEARVS